MCRLVSVLHVWCVRVSVCVCRSQRYCNSAYCGLRAGLLSWPKLRGGASRIAFVSRSFVSTRGRVPFCVPLSKELIFTFPPSPIPQTKGKPGLPPTKLHRRHYLTRVKATEQLTPCSAVSQVTNDYRVSCVDCKSIDPFV